MLDMTDIFHRRTMRFLTLALCYIVCSGCAGTVFTRMTNSPFGQYPGEAVYLDAKFIISPDLKHDSPLVGLLSIIPDLVIDTLLMPIDFVAWPFGYKR